MELYVQSSAGTSTLVVSGRVSAEVAETLKERLHLQLREHGHALVLDLSRVEFMGSAGIGALIFAVKEARAHGGELVVAAPSGVVHTLLNVSGLLDFVRHAHTVEAAVELLKA
jgi:anti-sigma B factor antagonist